MDRILTFTVDKNCLLKDYLRSRFSGRRIHFLREKGRIKVNGHDVTVRAELKKGDELMLCFTETETFDYAPKDMGIVPVYEDEDILVAFKPQGVPSMPAAPHFADNLFNGLKFLYPEGVFRVVTRLDKDTSGLVLIAKNALAHSVLFDEIRSLDKTYVALCEGNIIAPIDIDAPILTCGGVKRMVAEGGKSAKTRVIASEKVGEYSLVTVKTETGRTHQIRVHLAHIGHPIVGDALYGSGGKGQMLTCCGLSFRHPVTGEIMNFTRNGAADLGDLSGFLK